MAVKPLISHTDVEARFGRLMAMAGVSSVTAIQDIAQAAIDEISRWLGYDPEIDETTHLPSVTEQLNGGRPVVVLKALVDTESVGAVCNVTEMGQALTRRVAIPAPNVQPSGDYFIGEEGYVLYRLAGVGSLSLGIWGANTNSTSISLSWAGSVVGGLRLQGDYTDQYRGVIDVTYTPAIKLSVLRQVALQFCRLDLLETISASAMSTGDQSISLQMPDDFEAERENLLNRLPVPILIGTGT
jgi:hypothetical protein